MLKIKENLPPPLVSIPCDHEAAYLARQILRRADATRPEVCLAIETLRQSTDWRDLNLARHSQERLRAADRAEAAEASRRQPDPAPAPAQPQMITLPVLSAPQASFALRIITLAAAAASIAVLAVMLWTAATTSSANAQQQAAIWRSQH